MSTVIVYALADPRTGSVRYIGITRRSAKARLREHKSHAARRSPEFLQWFEELKERELQPYTLVLEIAPADAEEAEGRWIAEYMTRGAPLLNVAVGGGKRGFKHTDEWKRANSDRMTGRLVSDETRRKLSVAKRGTKRPDLAERNRKSARLSAEQVAEIRRRLEAGEKGVRLAGEFGVAPSVVCLIRQNKRR